MKVTEIKFNRRVNLGNYESADLEMTAVLAENDDVSSCTSKLISLVEGELGLAEKPVSKPEPKEEKVEEKVEEPKEEPKKKAKKKTTKKKVAKKKDEAVAYDRSLDHHKTELANILKKKFPNWKNDSELKPKISKMAKEVLPSQPFLDSEGNVLESFLNLIDETVGGDDL